MAPKPPVGTGSPAGLAPPVKVALARAVTKMPRNSALPGTPLLAQMGRIPSVHSVNQWPISLLPIT